MDNTMDAAVMRGLVDELMPADWGDGPAVVGWWCLGIAALLILGAAVTVWVITWRRRRQATAEPPVSVRTSPFAIELARCGIADPVSDARARADGPHPLPGQNPWSWQ